MFNNLTIKHIKYELILKYIVHTAVLGAGPKVLFKRIFFQKILILVHINDII